MGSPPLTAPAPVFGLRKTWLDPGPGIAMVQVHYTTSAHGTAPDWTDAEQIVLAPRSHPQASNVRTAVLEVPRTVDGATDFALHHFFFVVGANDRTASPVFTEDIVAPEVTYSDPEGRYTAVGLVWSVVDDDVRNYTSAVMDGLPFETMGAAPEDGNVYEFVRAQPLPHVFRGRVWGVRGTSIRYGYHLIRHGQLDPADNIERWDDNGGQGWIIEL